MISYVHELHFSYECLRLSLSVFVCRSIISILQCVRIIIYHIKCIVKRNTQEIYIIFSQLVLIHVLFVSSYIFHGSCLDSMKYRSVEVVNVDLMTTNGQLPLETSLQLQYMCFAFGVVTVIPYEDNQTIKTIHTRFSTVSNDLVDDCSRGRQQKK